jgi:hypothetical protein
MTAATSGTSQRPIPPISVFHIVARKQPNVYCEVSALYYRPWQFYNILVTAQEYIIHNRNKIS